MRFGGAIRALECALDTRRNDLYTQEDLALAFDAIHGSMYEEKWRDNAGAYPDRPAAIRRAIERLSAIPDDLPVLPTPTDLPPLGIGWGTYGWRGDPDCVSAALAFGAVLVDTAATYGYGRVELALGAAGIRNRGKTWLATKFARNHARPKAIFNSVSRSLAALRVESLDLLQLHWPTPAVVPFEETLGAMADQRFLGRVRQLGLCNVSVDQLHVARSRAPIACVQVRINYHDISALGPLKAYCDRAGIRMIAHSPCAQGVAWKQGRPSFPWFVEQGVIPIPGSNEPRHIRENLNGKA